MFSSFTVVLQLYCCSPALLLFPSFTVVLHFTAVLQLYYCFPALLLFYTFATLLEKLRTTVKLENNSKSGEEQ
jgi:hypothetical protein